MITWGVIVFVGLWLILADIGAVRSAKLMGNPILVHIIVIGSGLLIHGGSADGAMAAIVSGCFSAHLRALAAAHARLHPQGPVVPGRATRHGPRLGVSP
jgi:hypothetical protein